MSLAGDGVTQQKQVWVPTWTPGANVTYAAWIKPTTLGGNTLGSIFHHGTRPTGTTRRMAFELEATNRMRFIACYATTDHRCHSPDSSITLGAWQHIAAVYSFSTPTTAPSLYINAVGVAATLDTAAAGGANTETGGPLTIGDDFNDSACVRHFDGLIAEAVCIAALLSAAEIAALYTLGAGALLPLYGYFPLDNQNPGGAVDLDDYSGNGRNLTAGSAVVAAGENPPIRPAGRRR